MLLAGSQGQATPQGGERERERETETETETDRQTDRRRNTNGYCAQKIYVNMYAALASLVLEKEENVSS